MSMNPVNRTIDPESQKLIDEYLEKGGTITKCKANTRSENVEYSVGFNTKRKKNGIED